jgi:hypothetical protein
MFLMTFRWFNVSTFCLIYCCGEQMLWSTVWLYCKCCRILSILNTSAGSLVGISSADTSCSFYNNYKLKTCTVYSFVTMCSRDCFCRHIGLLNQSFISTILENGLTLPAQRNDDYHDHLLPYEIQSNRLSHLSQSFEFVRWKVKM